MRVGHRAPARQGDIGPEHRDYQDRLARNGIWVSDTASNKVPAEDSDEIRDMLSRGRRSPPPTEQEWKRYCHEATTLVNEATFCYFTGHRLFKHLDYGDSSERKLVVAMNDAWSAYKKTSPKLLEGLKAPQPDYSESIRRADLSTAARDRLGPNISVSRKHTTVAYLTAECKSRDITVRSAVLQNANNGAVMVSTDSEIAKALKQEWKYGPTRALTISLNADNVEIHAHHAELGENNKHIYFNTQVFTGNFTGTLEGFQASYRAIRNAQGWARNRLRERFNAIDQAFPSFSSDVTYNANRDVEEERVETNDSDEEHEADWPPRSWPFPPTPPQRTQEFTTSTNSTRSPLTRVTSTQSAPTPATSSPLTPTRSAASRDVFRLPASMTSTSPILSSSSTSSSAAAASASSPTPTTTHHLPHRFSPSAENHSPPSFSPTPQRGLLFGSYRPNTIAPTAQQPTASAAASSSPTASRLHRIHSEPWTTPPDPLNTNSSRRQPRAHPTETITISDSEDSASEAQIPNPLSNFALH